MDGHWTRLQNGLKFLKIPYQDSQDRFLDVTTKLLEQNQMETTQRVMIYAQITRGAPPKRNHAFPAESEQIKPTVYIFCQEIRHPDSKKWNEGFSAALEPDRRWGRVDIKTVNLLPNVLAYQDAKEQGADDAILVRDGVAMEGAHNNFYAVFDGGKVVTHPVTNNILPGITRAILLEEARANGIPVEERPIHVEELRHAEEAFFTSTTTEVKPCISIDKKPVGDGKVGPVTKWLSSIFLARIERDTGVSLREE
jgi:D-alanine transaminase